MIRVLLLATVAASMVLWMGCQDAAESEEKFDAQPAPARVVVVRLHGFIGCGVDAELIRDPLAQLLADVQGGPDAIVFSIESGGGMLNRVGALSDLLHSLCGRDTVECIGWITRAESAAAMVAMTLPDLWIASDGTIGGAVGVRAGADGWESLAETEQQAIRYMAAASAARGGHDRELALSLVTPSPSDSGQSRGVRVLAGEIAEQEGLAVMARTLEEALDERFEHRGWEIDLESSDAVSAGIAEAEGIRERFDSIRRRFEIAIQTDGADAAMVEVARGYLDEAVELSTRDNLPTRRAMAFSAGFEWIAAALDRLDAASGEARD